MESNTEMLQSEYKKEIEQWAQNRVQKLCSHDGWLTIAGLVWLKNTQISNNSGGKNGIISSRKYTIGFGTGNDIELPVPSLLSLGTKCSIPKGSFGSLIIDELDHVNTNTHTKQQCNLVFNRSVECRLVVTNTWPTPIVNLSTSSSLSSAELQTDSLGHASIISVFLKPESPTTSDSKDQQQVDYIDSGISFLLIDRSGEVGVRIKDKFNARLRTFQGISYFPISLKWKLNGVYKPYTTDNSRESNKSENVNSINILNATGQVTVFNRPGYIEFEYEGTSHRLDVIDELGQEWWIIMSDLTSDKQTYGGGRFLMIEHKQPHNQQQNVILDFNKAYNPPCAFTEFSTCPRPPQQNCLNLNIEAGEKMYQHKS